MKIFLVGFMGCGKTTLGKRLASKLNYQFIDMDKVIEVETQLSINDYFSKFGEDAFREIESTILKNTIFPENAVVATGGGAPCFFDNIEWMNANGTTVYLSLSPKSLAKRLVSATEQRPILKNLKPDELEQFIAERLQLREPFYKQAKIIIKGLDQTPERVAAIIQEKV
ncbi:MAG TPA: shikimate kinase [Pedobacter sp.]